jgi:Ca2+-binding RTX toxin-like protein
MSTQTFTTGNDTFTVNSPSAIYDLDFLAGDDRLNVYDATSVTAHMGDGNDLAVLRAGSLNIFGDAGADRFDIYKGGATLDGGADNDRFNIYVFNSLTANGGTGDDRFDVLVDGGSLTLHGDDGNDDFYGHLHNASGSIYGDAGNDYFIQFLSFATLLGGTGNDIYRVTVGDASTIVENVGEGTDSVQVARGYSYTLPDNVENISVQGFSGSTTSIASLTGNALNNHIVGHNNVEVIFGLDGNDNLSGKGGNDTLSGGNGNDILDGGTGDDSLDGGTGNDTLQGRMGDDSMFGGAGNDVYYVDSLSDSVTESSGQGTDTVRVSVYGYGLPDNVENGIISGSVGLQLVGNNLANQLTGNAGSDSILGGGGNDTIKGGTGDDSLNGGDGDDVLLGGDGIDILTGEAGNDVLHGGNGDDQLGGWGGSDTLYGDDGNDLLYGLADADTLSGGSGNDTFQYDAVSDSAPGSTDVILDFYSVDGEGADDQLDLSLIDADTTVDGNQAFSLNLNGAPRGIAGDLWYTYVNNPDGSQDITWYGDTNGDSAADLQIAVHVVNGEFWWTDDVTF